MIFEIFIIFIACNLFYNAARINNVLRAVSSTYYCGDQMVESIEGDDKVEKSKSEFQYSTLDSLLSPLRKPTIFGLDVFLYWLES